MKATYQICIVAMIAMASCNSKTSASLENTSPNGKSKLVITAKRDGGADPWQVEMKVKAYNWDEGELKFELTERDINNQNVSFKWDDDYHCTIVYKLDDKTERRFKLVASPAQLQMAEIDRDSAK